MVPKKFLLVLVVLFAAVKEVSTFSSSGAIANFGQPLSRSACLQQRELRTMALQMSADADKRLPRVEIEYCTGCRWMLRSAWLAQELLTTFESDLESVTLKPSRVRPGPALYPPTRPPHHFRC
eukprot:3614417-Rhodomonas_salina.3